MFPVVSIGRPPPDFPMIRFERPTFQHQSLISEENWVGIFFFPTQVSTFYQLNNIPADLMHLLQLQLRFWEVYEGDLRQ